jgi:hypothetical protein
MVPRYVPDARRAARAAASSAPADSKASMTLPYVAGRDGASPASSFRSTFSPSATAYGMSPHFCASAAHDSASSTFGDA